MRPAAKQPAPCSGTKGAEAAAALVALFVLAFVLKLLIAAALLAALLLGASAFTS